MNLVTVTLNLQEEVYLFNIIRNLLMSLPFPTVGSLSVTGYDERKYFTSAVEHLASVTL